MKLNDKIAIAGVLVAIISILVTFMIDTKEKAISTTETNTTNQITHGSQSPIINTDRDVNVNY